MSLSVVATRFTTCMPASCAPLAASRARLIALTSALALLLTPALPIDRAASRLAAQTLPTGPDGATRSGGTPTARSGWRRFVERGPTRWGVALARDVATYTASHNEPIDGALTTLGVQAAIPLFRFGPTRAAWLFELQPLVLVTSDAPAHRVPKEGIDPDANDPAVLARYTRRNGYGAGLGVLGAEARTPLGARTTLVVNVTSGGAWFSQVVPYGKATRANFTVAPGLLLERRLATGGVAFGYVLHHLSNASFGGANPGMNSHMFQLRLSR